LKGINISDQLTSHFSESQHNSMKKSIFILFLTMKQILYKHQIRHKIVKTDQAAKMNDILIICSGTKAMLLFGLGY
jgi:hypothetical protein